MKKSFNKISVLFFAALFFATACSYNSVTIPSKSKTENVQYKMKCYFQNIYDDEYTLDKKLSKTYSGKPGEETAVVPVDVTGFSMLPYTQEIIKGDYSTVVNVYYDRTVYEVKYQTDGGNYIDPQYYRYGAKINLPDNPVKNGYIFGGWDEKIPETMPAIDIIYYAQWFPEVYKIVYLDRWDEEFSGVLAADSPTKHSYGTDTYLPAPSKTDYKFLGWYLNSACAASPVTKIGAFDFSDIENIYVYAKWIANGVSVDELGFVLTDITDTSIVYDFKITDENPKLSQIKQILTDNLNIKVTLDFSECFGLSNLQSSCFEGCTNLMGIVLPKTLTMIGDYAFKNCENLTELNIPANVYYIGSDIFTGSNNLEKITVDSNNKTYDSRNDCNAIIKTDTKELILGCKNTVIPDDVDSLGKSSFAYCDALTEITIPDNILYIGQTAFSNCQNLEKVTIGEKVVSIGVSAFNNCPKLTEIVIPDSVVSVASSAFSNCAELSSISIGSGISELSDNLFNGCKNLTNIDIPTTITSIGKGTFYNCKGLESIEFSQNLKSIGESAFSSCTSLTEVVIPDTVTSMGERAFERCNGVKTVEIGDGISSIGKYCFYSCDELESVVIGDGVTTIGYDAFYSCDKLTSITFGKNVTTLGEESFMWCQALESVTIPNTVTRIEDSVFRDCYKLKEITVPSSVTYLGADVFQSCFKLQTATINGPIPAIEAGLFENCQVLTTVTIPASVASMGSWAFSRCSALKTINFGGTQAQWNKITGKDDAELPTGVSVNYNYNK